MSDKVFILFGMFIGSTIGGYIPSFLGAGVFSLWSIILSGLGGIIGIIIAFKFTRS